MPQLDTVTKTLLITSMKKLLSRKKLCVISEATLQSVHPFTFPFLEQRNINAQRTKKDSFQLLFQVGVAM